MYDLLILDLYCLKQENDIQGIDRYIENLYDFATFVASYHKPCMAIANGRASGAGAAILGSINFPLVTPYTTINYSETGYGLCPHAGNIYILSRMGGEIGTYLALTGDYLKGSDFVHLGISKKTVQITEEFKNHFKFIANENMNLGVKLCLLSQFYKMVKIRNISLPFTMLNDNMMTNIELMKGKTEWVHLMSMSGSTQIREILSQKY